MFSSSSVPGGGLFFKRKEKTDEQSAGHEPELKSYGRK